MVYEDAAVLVIDKPAGLVVHPAPGHAGGTLVNALLAHTTDLSLHGDIRPGIVHRLDKDTSGLLVVAKTDAAHADLVRQHQARTMRKEYLALVLGTPQPADRPDRRAHWPPSPRAQAAWPSSPRAAPPARATPPNAPTAT